jgi:cytochrome c-type biogenesis protein CcmH
MRLRRLIALLAVALLLPALVAGATAAAAAAAQPRASFNDVEDEVMCDTCNVPLNIAESPRADQERREIRDLIAQGLTKQQIKDELARRYGPQILAMPPDRGFSVAAYAVPIAVVLLLAVAAAFLLPRWRRRTRSGLGGPAPAAVPELSAADAARLDEDLARWDR